MALSKILFTNLLAAGALSASTTAVGYAVASLGDFRPYTWWKGTAMPEYVTVDYGSPVAANMLAVFGHDLGTRGATLEVRGSTDNFAASDVLVASKTPTTDDPFSVSFTQVAYRYWRLKATGATVVSLACPILGLAMELPCGLEAPFDPVGRKVEGRRISNNNGQPLGNLVDFESWEATLKLRAITWSWVRATWLPAWKSALRSQPFAFAWDPTNYPDEVRLVTTDGDFDTPHSSGSICELSVKLKGVA